MGNDQRKGNHDNDPETDPSNFSVVEEPIDLSVQKEYQDLSASIESNHVNYEEVLAQADELFVSGTPIEEKKRILILLAHLGTIESAKILEKYLRMSEEGLRDWTVLSLKECRMFLENVSLNEEGGFISTGLGGRGNRLRYYFITSTRQGRPLTNAEREDLQEGFKGSSGQYESEIEEITFGTNYAMIRILISMDVAVGEVIEEGIRRCNKSGGVLSDDYYVTNVKKPTKKEVSTFLKDIRQRDK